MPPQLGTLKKIDNLRKIWPNEASDFTPWLAQEENLAKLGEAINMDIVLDEIESPVGNFNVDLLCHEDITNRRIVIENQIEETNHDHLGKIITYAAGKSADILIWIVKHARDEHKQAVEWLNEHTDDNIGIFLVEIGIWEIDDSNPAANFSVVERPNDWAKAVKATGNLTDTEKMNFAFWQQFGDYASSNQRFTKEFKVRKSQPHYWYDLAVGSSSYHITMTVNTREKKVTCGIYIDDDKDLYKTFESHKKEIEEELGIHMDWQPLPGKKVSRIDTSIPCEVQEEKNWNECFRWLCETGLKIKKSFVKWG